MKLFLPLVCSLLLIGCSDSSVQNQTQSASAPAVSETLPAQAETPSAATEESAPAALPKETGNQKTATADVPAIEDKKVATATPAPKSTAATVDAGVLFGQKCASCHGAKAEKTALGKSQIIADFNEQQIKDALHGYQAGTYGKDMKVLMQGQAKALSNAQIDALAKHISAL